MIARAIDGRGRRRLWGVVFAICALLLVVLSTGCARGKVGQPLAQWVVHVPGAPPRPVTLPTHLHELPFRPLVYELETDVKVDEALRGRDLDLVIAYLPASASLRVNGRDVRDPHDVLPADQYRRAGPQRWLVPAAESASGGLHLELQVTHRWSQSAWLDLVPELVPAGYVSRQLALNRFLNEKGAWCGLIAFFQIGASFLAVFFYDTRRRVYLWFATQGILAAYYPAYILGLTIGLASPVIESSLLAQTLSLACIVSVYCTHEFFGLKAPSRVWLVLLVVSVALPIPSIVYAGMTGFLIMDASAPVVVLCVVSVVIYQVVVGARLLKRGESDRGITLFYWGCWVALGTFAWPDLVAWAGLGEVLGGARPACLGLGLFGIFQTMLLSRSYFRTLEQSDRLNDRLRRQLHDLEGRKGQIEKLNEELREQIGRRTAHILAALANSESLSKAVSLEPGAVVEGRYRVVATLGEGGMGTVYEVERLSDGVHLALKVTQELRGLALAQLAREAQIATRISHPNVVGIVDADVAQGGYVYLVMELVRGCSLADCKDREPGWYLHVLVELLEGLRALHAQKIVHRDLKPSNVLLSGDLDRAPIVKITDFGISRSVLDDDLDPARDGRTKTVSTPRGEPKSVGDPTAHPRARPRTNKPSAQLTRPGTIPGTPAYVAPELARGAPLTPAADVFSVGVLAYRLFTGEQPFRDPPILALIAGREIEPNPPLAKRCPNLPARVADAVNACLAMTPEGRPAIDDLVAALREARDALQWKLPVEAIPPVATV